MRWMKLEPIIQSEVNQKDIEFRKTVMMTLYVRQQERQMCRVDFWTLRERERVG